MDRAHGLGLLIAAGWSLASSGVAAAEPEPVVTAIEMWTRTPGQHGREHELARTRVVSMELQRLPSQQGPLRDVQYGGTRTFRYVTLDDLIRAYRPPAESDTALLHFANGMAIPLRFRDAGVMHRLRPAIALAIETGDGWTSAFPPLSRTDAFYFDVRPTRFAGNKLVVADLWHPSLRAGTQEAFSPWRHANALTGVEFVDDAAFLAQFEPSAETREGARTYGQVCRFCHGARREGAQFGWDFVDPIPISDYRKKDVSLYYHIKYRVVDATARGLLMPALPFLTERDAADLLAWLRALAAQPLRPYATPSHAAR
jgi:mono/diheme cytochrome c family protein